MLNAAAIWCNQEMHAEVQSVLALIHSSTRSQHLQTNSLLLKLSSIHLYKTAVKKII